MRVVLVREAYARSHGAIAVTTAYIMIRFDSIRFDSSNGARLSRSRSKARVHPTRATTARVSRLYLYELPHGVTQSGHEDLLEVRNHVYRHAA